MSKLITTAHSASAKVKGLIFQATSRGTEYGTNYGYDPLGQVTSCKKYWSDATPVASQQFEYAFDDIGDRKSIASGGNQWGSNLRYANYTVNSLNQYTSRTVPGALDILGTATNSSTVTVNNRPSYRKGEGFWTQHEMVC